MSKSIYALFVCCVVSTPVLSDMIPMKDFIQLKRGMTEAEVLYRVGTYDHETIASNYHDHIIRKTWFYIPEQKGSGDWITEIVFDSRGVIRELDRYRVRN